MWWSDTFWSAAFRAEMDLLLGRYVPADTDITYQCIPAALALAAVPNLVAYAKVLRLRLGSRPQAEGARRKTERLWLERGGRATEAALASAALFAAGVVALRLHRVRTRDANTHCLVYLGYRALWSLGHAYGDGWLSPGTAAAASTLRRWLAGPACAAALAALAALQVLVMFYAAACYRDANDAGARNIWYAAL